MALKSEQFRPFGTEIRTLSVAWHWNQTTVSKLRFTSTKHNFSWHWNQNSGTGIRTVQAVRHWNQNTFDRVALKSDHYVGCLAECFVVVSSWGFGFCIQNSHATQRFALPQAIPCQTRPAHARSDLVGPDILRLKASKILRIWNSEVFKFYECKVLRF